MITPQTKSILEQLIEPNTDPRIIELTLAGLSHEDRLRILLRFIENTSKIGISSPSADIKDLTIHALAVIALTLTSDGISFSGVSSIQALKCVLVNLGKMESQE